MELMDWPSGEPSQLGLLLDFLSIGLLDFFFSRIFGWWFSLFLLLGAAFLGYSLPSLSCQKDLSSFFVYAYDSNEKKINVQ